MVASTAAGRLRGLLLSEDDADAALLAEAEGVTSDLVHFVGALDANVFMHAALELPPSHEPLARTPWQEDHIKAVLSQVQSLRFLHSKLVPDELSEARFWQTYFHLCQNLLSEASRREPPSESAAPLTPPHVQTVEHDPAAKRDAEAVISPVSAMAKEDEIASEAAPAVQEAHQTGDEESVEQFLARELGEGDADDDGDELAHEDLEALMVTSESEEE
jgi:BSD domain